MCKSCLQLEKTFTCAKISLSGSYLKFIAVFPFARLYTTSFEEKRKALEQRQEAWLLELTLYFSHDLHSTPDVRGMLLSDFQGLFHLIIVQM